MYCTILFVQIKDRHLINNLMDRVVASEKSDWELGIEETQIY